MFNNCLSEYDKICEKEGGTMAQTQKLEIIFIRHGDTEGASCEERCHCDISLTDLGRRQAALLGERLAHGGFDAVFSSPLVRAVQTAAATAQRQSEKPEIELMPELAEVGTTAGYAFCTQDYLKSYYDRLFFCPDSLGVDRAAGFPSESEAESALRAKRCAEYFRERFTYGERIAVFSHGSFATLFLRAALGIEESGFIFSMNNTAVSKLKYTSDGRVRLSFHNDTSHLRVLKPDMDFTI